MDSQNHTKNDDLNIFKSLFYNSTCGIMSENLTDGKILDANSTISNLFGYTINEFKKLSIKNIFDIHHPDTKKNISNRTENNVFKGKVIGVKKNGDRFLCEFISTVFGNENGTKVLCTIVNDLSKTFKLNSKATNGFVWDCDFVSKKIYLTKGVLGYFENEFEVSIDWCLNKIHRNDIDRVKLKLDSIILNQTDLWEDEFRFLAADGTYRYIYNRGYLTYNDGKVIKLLSTLQDVTALKKEEQQLKMLESVITNANDAVIVTEANTSTKPGLKIIYVNDAFSRITGYTATEVIGKSPRFLQGINTDKNELRRISTLIKNFDSCETTLLNYKKNGEEFWFNYSIIPLADENGEFKQIITVGRDITQQKLYEIEREKIILELSQNLKDIKQFSYVISHSLRAPIANLLGLTSILDYHEITDESLKQIIDGIKISALKFDDTVKDLTKVLEIKDQIGGKKEVVLFEDVLLKVFNQLNISLNSPTIDVKYDFSKASNVKFTSAYLENIFLNLISNAVKYRAIDRDLSITITTIQSDKFIDLKFSDNGIGIDILKHKQKLFKLYQRFHDKSEGKGLGLYMMKTQMEALGGTITIESEVDTGTTILLRFIKE